jgi:hypothetical protein
MAAITHLTVACIFKNSLTKKVSLGVCIFATYFLDIIALLFSLSKFDTYLYNMTHIEGSFWSHSLIMSLIWSLIFSTIYLISKKNLINSFIVFIIVFSHWIIDLITWPLGCIWKNAPGLYLIWSDTFTVGFGLYNSVSLAIIIEIFSLLISIVLLKNIYKKRSL